MFKFFKEKIKSWIGKSKEKIEEKASESKRTGLASEEGGIKKIKEDEKGVLKQVKPSMEFNAATQKYEIDLKKTKERIETIKTAQEIGTLEKKEEKPSIFQRIKEKFSYKLSEPDFNDIFENLEIMLLENNVALESVENIKKQLKQELLGKEIKKESIEKEIKAALKKAIENLLIEPDDILSLVKEKQPFIILFFGINGCGKTTSIAKLVNLLLKNNISCVLAAADTFRAASIEQLQEHASKLGVKLIKHDYGADPSAVAFDAIKHAKAHKIQAVLIDTAGRMHTQENLLSEMEKICRVTNPDLKIFVAESIAGNDAIQQAKNFNESIGIDGSILTKADVDEKGGTVISISHATHKPIFYLGTGQKYEDLKLFDKQEFIKTLGL